MVFKFSEVLHPALQLFLSCRQWVSILVLHCLGSPLQFDCQLLSYQVQVFKVPFKTVLVGLVFS